MITHPDYRRTDGEDDAKITRLQLLRAENGGWLVEKPGDDGRFRPVVVGAFTNTSDMLDWLAGKLDLSPGKPDEPTKARLDDAGGAR